MPKYALLSQAGKNIGEINLNKNVFGIEPNEQALYDVVKAQRAAMRQGTHKTKTRTEVKGGGKKPWRQKGTGRARQGSTRSPQWVGGGVVFGPTPRDYSVKVNKKVRRLALKSALSAKVKDQTLIVLDDLKLNDSKTKDMISVLTALKVSGKALIALPEENEVIARAAKNIPGVSTCKLSHASVYEILNYTYLITTQDGVKKYEEGLK